MEIPYPHQVDTTPLIRTDISATTINPVFRIIQPVAHNSINTSSFTPLRPRILFKKQNSKTPNRLCNRKSYEWSYRFMNDILLNYTRMPEIYPLTVPDHIGTELYHTPRLIPAPFGFDLRWGTMLTLYIYGVPQLRFRCYPYNNDREYYIRLLEILPSTDNKRLRLKRLFLRHMGFDCTKRDHKSMQIDGHVLNNDAFMSVDQHSTFSLIGAVKI